MENVFLIFLSSPQTLWYSILPDFSLDLQRGSSLESQPYPDLHTPPVSKRARARTTGWSLGSGERKERKTADVGVSSGIPVMGQSGSIFCTYRWTL